MSLADYVAVHAKRGACTCGQCIDAPPNPKLLQPPGHTADLVFFKVANNGATTEEFRQLVVEEFPRWLDGREHSYIELGADIGDQGLALMAMGLGAVLGVWTLMTPLMFGFDESLAMEMAGRGFVHIMAEKHFVAKGEP